MIKKLEAIYGTGAEEQRVRYTAVSQTFTNLYGPGKILAFRAPGRVNLIGEHTDYNHGYVMPVALDKDVLLFARPRNDNHIRLHNMEPEFASVEFEISENIPPAAHGGWSNYVRGVAQEIARELKHPLHGFDGLITAAAPHGVPRGAGLSSSSAIIVAAGTALAHINNWQPAQTVLAERCATAEWYVGARGGIMDQFISVMGHKDHALFLDCRPDADSNYRTEHVPLPQGYSLLIINSGVKHSNVSGGYNQRVAACRAGVGLLQPHHPGITHLRDVENGSWEALAPWLPEEITVGELKQQGIQLGDIPGISSQTRLKVKSRCRHVWTENWRVRQAIVAMRAGDVQTLGRLMQAAHSSARDDYEVSCPELEVLVGLLTDFPGVIASRLTGAGWGGCVVALVEETAVSPITQHVQTHYPAATGIQPDVFACASSNGAGFVAQFAKNT